MLNGTRNHGVDLPHLPVPGRLHMAGVVPVYQDQHRRQRFKGVIKWNKPNEETPLSINYVLSSTIAILLHLFGLLAPPESSLKFVAFMGLPFSLDPERENACSALISLVSP